MPVITSPVERAFVTYYDSAFQHENDESLSTADEFETVLDPPKAFKGTADEFARTTADQLFETPTVFRVHILVRQSGGAYAPFRFERGED